MMKQIAMTNVVQFPKTPKAKPPAAPPPLPVHHVEVAMWAFSRCLEASYLDTVLTDAEFLELRAVMNCAIPTPRQAKFLRSIVRRLQKEMESGAPV